MRIIVLPVGRCRFLEENKSGLRFQRNKIWRFTECMTPYNRPSWVSVIQTCYPHHVVREYESIDHRTTVIQHIIIAVVLIIFKSKTAVAN